MVERSFQFEIPTWEELKELASVSVCFDYGSYHTNYDESEIKVKRDKIIVKTENTFVLTRANWEKFESGDPNYARFVNQKDKDSFAYISHLCFYNGTEWDNPFSATSVD